MKKTLATGKDTFSLFHLPKLSKIGLHFNEDLPLSIKILLENSIRNWDEKQINFKDIETLANWHPKIKKRQEIAFKPGRVILQDFTGVPCIVDLAAMRSAMKRLGGDYKKINPQVPCDLVIDHSVQVDAYSSSKALKINVKKEFQRNKERYEFLKWGQKVFKNFRVIPPSTGIIHQVNLEYLAQGLLKTRFNKEVLIYPDTLVGTDSHTTMINGLGIVGWGVGGIEAEAVMLGEPIYMLMPEVIGFKLEGKLAEGITATDLVLTVTQILREKGVVGKFVEFIGHGLNHLSLPDRATLSNMAPEYGATLGLFPIDEETIRYYKNTGRSTKHVDLIERYMKEQGLFYSSEERIPKYSDMIELNLNSVTPSLAGPKRPQDRIPLEKLKKYFQLSLSAPIKDRGFGLDQKSLSKSVIVQSKEKKEKITHGAVVIASITSCTNTSNPSVLIAAGLLAKKASLRGLKVPKFVKTSFTPGSQVVEEYLKAANLMGPLEQLGFHIVGYGCATCIGNSGPLPEEVSVAIKRGKLVAASVLSGNRNFEGRINPDTKANYLTSPPLVIAYALAGTVDIDFSTEPLGKDKNSQSVFLNDIWPSQEEINSYIHQYVKASAFRKKYKNVFLNNLLWDKIESKTAPLYSWRKASTYIQEPPFFTDMTLDLPEIEPIKNARVLVMVGDSITTDHISPAGAILSKSPAGKYLMNQGISAQDFNSYGSRRGNDRIMTRGTFANIRLRNRLAPGTEGSWTYYFPEKKILSIYEAAQKYKKLHIPLLVLAGKEYGTGSSRDWAAKGTSLLGIRVVLAQSYERIHRSNLVGMGVLPLEFKKGESVESLKLQGNEVFEFYNINNNITPQQEVRVVALSSKGHKKEFFAICRLDTPIEIDYYRNRGILQTVLRKLNNL